MTDKTPEPTAPFEMRYGQRHSIPSHASSGPGKVVFSSQSGNQAQSFIERAGPQAKSYVSVAETPSSGFLGR